jgi:hypothetical protein
VFKDELASGLRLLGKKLLLSEQKNGAVWIAASTALRLSPWLTADGASGSR